MIKIALVGCGRISKMHLQSIKSIPDLQLVALCDIDPEKKTLAEKWNVPMYSDHKSLLEKEEFDVLAIATPNGTHYDIAMDSVKANKHILLEKPVTIKNEEADNLIEAAEKQSVKFFAVKQVRYNPAVQVLKQAVDEGKLGKIFSTSLVVRWTRPQAYFDDSNWRGTLELDGGTLLNQGIHYVDIMQWIVGMPNSVYAIKKTLCHDIEIEDFVMSMLYWDNDTIGNLEFTMNTFPHNLECSLTVMGEAGTVKLSGSAMNEIEIWEVKDYPRPPISEGLPPNVYAGGLYQGSCPNHIYVYQDLVKALGSANHIYINGKEARKSLYIVNAIYESSAEAKVIEIPEN